MLFLHLYETVSYLKIVPSTSVSRHVYAVDEAHSLRHYKGGICISPFGSQFPSYQYKPY